MKRPAIPLYFFKADIPNAKKSPQIKTAINKSRPFCPSLSILSQVV